MSWYQEMFLDSGRSGALWLLVGFVVTYGLTRWVTTSIRRRALSGEVSDGPVNDIHIGGVHVHHQVWGILLVLLTGLLVIRFDPRSPWIEVLAALFGVGAALALDEFALWLHLEDVYWSEEGRKSIDAVMVAAVFGLVLLVGSSPVAVSTTGGVDGGWLVTVAVLLVHIGYVVLCLLKGKIVTGLFGLPIPLLGLVGAVRIAQPESFWARRFYAGRPEKLAKARARHEVVLARRDRLRDLLS